MIDFHKQLAIIPEVYETAQLQDNLEHSGGISLSWKSADDTEIPIGSHITYPVKNEDDDMWKAQEIWRNDRIWNKSQIASIRYILIDPYAPTRQGIYYKYDPQFKHPQALLDRTPFWIRSMDAESKPINLRTTSYTGMPWTIAKKLVDFLAEYANETEDTFFAETVGLIKEDGVWYSPWEVNIPEPAYGVDTAAIISVPFDGCSIKGAADAIANAMGCNVYWDWSTKTVRFIAGTTIQGETYNCFHVLGGTTNMGKVSPSGSYAAVTQRLALKDPMEGEDTFIINEGTANEKICKILKGSIISMAGDGMRLTEDLILDDIYPKMELYIKTARERVCRMTDENGNFIVDHFEKDGHVVPMGTEGAVEVLKKFSKWYVTFAVRKEGSDPSQWEDYEFDQGNLIDDKPLAMLFQIDYKNPENMSSLVGRQYELTYYPKIEGGYDLYDKNDDVATAGSPFHLEGGEFYIAFEAVGERILPTTSKESVDMYPVVGKKVTLVNVALTQEKSRAQDELLSAAKEVIALMQTPSGQYSETVVFAEAKNGEQPKDTIAPVMIGGDSPFDTRKHGPVVTGLSLNLDTNIAEVTVGSWTRKTKTGGMADKIDAVTITVNSATTGGDAYSDGVIGEGGGYTPQGSGSSTEVSTIAQTQPKADTLFVASLGNAIDVVSCLANGKAKLATDIYSKVNCYYGTSDITEVCNIKLSSSLPSGVSVHLETSPSNTTGEALQVDHAESMSQNHYWLRIHINKDTDLSSGKLNIGFVVNHPYHGNRGLEMVINPMIPGASSVRIDLTNDADYISLDSVGKVRFDRTITTKARIYDGSTIATSGVAKHTTLNKTTLKIGDVEPTISDVVNGEVTISWAFKAGQSAAAEDKLIELSYTKNGETLVYSAIFSFGAFSTDAIYQLSPSLDVISFARKASDNTLEPASRDLGLKLVKYDGTSTTELSKCPSGYSVKIAYDNVIDSSSDGTEWELVNDAFKSYPIANDTDVKNIYIALFYSVNNVSVQIDRETIPIVKDGAHGDGVNTIVRTFNISAYDKPNEQGKDYPDDILLWLSESPAVTEAKPYLWCKEEVTFKYQTKTEKYYLLGVRGQNGIDAQDIEWVYVRTTENVAPTIVDDGTNDFLNDDYKPLAKVASGRISGEAEGNANVNVRCTDDPKGVNDTWKYEWEIKREKGAATNGHRQWVKYEIGKAMTLHNNLSESAFIIDIDNDSDQFGTDSEDDVLVEQKRSTNVFLLYGTQAQTLNADNAHPKGVTAVLKYSDDDTAVPTSVAEVTKCQRDATDLTKGIVEVTIKKGKFAKSGMYVLITASCARGSKNIRFTLEKVKGGKKGENPIIYQIAPSKKAFAFYRSDSNALLPNSVSSQINVAKTEGNETTYISEAINGITFDWGFDEEAATNDHKGKAVGSSIEISNTDATNHYKVWVELSTGDKETLPITKDGAHGDEVKSITRTYAISAHNEPDKPAQQLYPTDISEWKETSDAVTETQPYLWVKEETAYRFKTTKDTRYYYIGKRGDNGIDAQDAEWVYIRTKTNVAPTIADDNTYKDSHNPSRDYKEDDHLPHVSGNSNIENNQNTYECTDNPKGVTEEWKYEWEIKRTKGDAVNGHRTWNPYSGTMTLHNNFAESTFVIDIDNDNDQFGTDSESRVMVAQTRVTNVSLLYGTQDLIFSKVPTAKLYYDNGTALTNTELNSVASVAVADVSNGAKTKYSVTVTIKKTPDNATTMPLSGHNGLYVVITGESTKGEKSIRFTLEKLMSGEKGKSPTIYQLALSQKSLSYTRSDSNELVANISKVQVNVKKTYLDDSGNYKSDIIKTAMTTEGITYSWGYDDEATAQATSQAIGTNVEVAAANVGTHKKVWILLSTKDREEVPIVKDGAHGDNAIRIDLDNENDSFLYTSGGTKVPSTFKVNSKASLFDGSVDKSNDTTWAVSAEGCTLESQATSRNIVVSAMTADTGKVTVQGTYTDAHGNQHVKTAILTLKKLVDVDKYDLVIEPNSVAYNATTDTPATSEISISVYKMTVKGERVLSAPPSDYKVYAGNAVATATATAGKYTATIDNSEIDELLVKIAHKDTATDILDAETIPVSKSYNGADGKNVVRLDIDNESDMIQTDSAGKITAARTIETTVRLFDGASEVDISTATITTANGPVVTGDNKIATFEATANGKGKKLSWAFIAGKTMSDYEIEISYKYNNVTYKAILSIVASKGNAILQLKPSHSALICSRGNDNTIGNPPALSLKIVKIDGSSTQEYDATESNLTSLGVFVMYAFYEVTAYNVGVNWPATNSVQAKTTNNLVSIALFNSSNVLLDKETIPVVKDGTNGSSIKKKSEENKYAVNDSGETAPTENGDDSQTAVANKWYSTRSKVTALWTANKWLWVKTIITWSDDSTTTLYTNERNPNDGIAGQDIIVDGATEMKYAVTDTNETRPTTIVKWDWRNAVPSTITNQTQEGAGVSGTIASDVTEFSLTYLGQTSATHVKIQYNSNGYAQMNTGTVLRIPVVKAGDTISVSSYHGQSNFTLGGENAQGYDNFSHVATAAEAAQGYVEMVCLENKTSYIYSITASIDTSSSPIFDWKDYDDIASDIVPGTWLWCKATTYFRKATSTPGSHDAGSSVNYSVSYNGEKGANGRAVKSITEYYKATDSNSPMSKPTSTSGWDSDPNLSNLTDNKWDADHKFLWNMEKVVYTESSGSETIEYSTPSVIAIWTKDGKGIDSIVNKYAISESGTQAPAETQTGAQGWDDNPIAPNATYPYLWNYEIINWTDGSTPSGGYSTAHVIGHFGADGGRIAFIYRWVAAGSTPDKPTIDIDDYDGDNTSWKKSAPNRPDNGTNHLWMSQNLITKDANGLETIDGTKWSTPVRISGDNGSAGEDGSDMEYIYILRTSKTTFTDDGDENKKPSAITKGQISPSGAANNSTNYDNTKDDFVPYRWYDHPQGVDKTNKYEYMSFRRKEKGSTTWGAFSDPIVWSHFGTNGMDGDGVEYVFVRTKGNTPPTFNGYKYSTNKKDSYGKAVADDEQLPLVKLSSGNAGDIIGNTHYNSSGYNSLVAECTDDPQGVTSTYMYEWVLKRTKGSPDADTGTRIWNEYSGTMSLWAKFGKDGDVWTIGTDGYWYKNGSKYTDTNHLNGIKAEGKDGTGVALKGTVDVVFTNQAESGQTSLQGLSNVSIGDCYVVNANRHLYFYNGTSTNVSGVPNYWTDMGEFKGEAGTSNFLHVAYADSITLTNGNVTAQNGFSVVKSKDSYPWVGLCVDENEIDPGANASSEQEKLAAAKLYKWNYVRGNDGTSPYVADLDNEMDSVACLVNGKPSSAASVSTNVYLYYGSSKIKFKVTSIKRNSLDVGTYGTGVSVKVGSTTIANASSFNSLTAADSAKIEVSYGTNAYISGKDLYTIVLQKDGDTSVERTLTLTINGVRPGQNGRNGTNGESVRYANAKGDGSDKPPLDMVSEGYTYLYDYTTYGGDNYCVFEDDDWQDYEANKGSLFILETDEHIYEATTSGWIDKGKFTGDDAVIYRLVPFATEIVKKKNSNLSPIASTALYTEVSKTVGNSSPQLISNNSSLPNTIKVYYKLNGGNETEINSRSNTTQFVADSNKVSNVTSSVEFILKINGVVADRENIPLVEDGTDGQSSFKSTVFCRTNTTPQAPVSTQGSYSTPSPASATDWQVKDSNGTAIANTYWSDGIPEGNAILWASTRIFSSDGKSPQQSAWTTPRPMTDTADFDVEFSSLANPNAPSGHPNTNTSQWSNTASADTIWMAMSECHNGVWSDWQVSKIKGEKGNDGTSPFVADLDNEMDSVACNANGKTSSAQSVSTNISLNHGSSLVGFTTAVYDTDPNGNAYTSGTKVNGITVSWNNVSPTERTHDTVTVAFDNATSVSKKVFCIQISNSASGEKRKLYFTVNGIKPGADGSSPTIYNLKPSQSQINVGRTDIGGYSPSTVSLTCKYTQRTGDSSIQEKSITGQIDSTYNVYFRKRQRSNNQWQGSYYLYYSYLNIPDTTYSLTSFNVATFDAVEFIMCTAPSSVQILPEANINQYTVIDKETVPIVCDGKSAVRHWLEISPSSVRVDSNSKLLSQLSYGSIYVEAWVQEGNNAPRKLTDEENATANIEVDGYIEFADGECPIDERVSIRDMYFSYDSTNKRFVFNGAGAQNHTSPLPKGTYFEHLDFYFEEDHKQVQLFVRGEKFKYEDFTQAELAELKGPEGPAGPDGDDAVTYTVSLDGSVFRYDSNNDNITSNIIAKVYRTVGSSTSQVTTGISKSDFKLFVLYTNGTQAEINANNYAFSNGEITSDYLNENGISGEDAIIVVFKNYWKATIHLTKDGEDGGEGAQGYGIKITIDRTGRSNYTEANWNSWAAIGAHDTCSWQTGDPVFTNCRVGDYYMVVGEAYDSGILHQATYKCTSRNSSSISGDCVSHVKGGSKGSRGLSIRGPRNWRKLLSTSGADLNFYQGADGEDFLDIVSFNPTDETEQNGDDHLYMCKLSYEATTSSTNPEDDTTHWKKADEYDFVATKLLYAVWAKIKQLETEMLKITGTNSSQGATVYMNPSTPFQVVYGGHKCMEIAVDPDTQNAYLDFYDRNGFVGRIDSTVFKPVGNVPDTWSQMRMKILRTQTWSDVEDIKENDVNTYYKFIEGYYFSGSVLHYNNEPSQGVHNENHGKVFNSASLSSLKITGWFANVNNGIHPYKIVGDNAVEVEYAYHYTDGLQDQVLEIVKP